MYYLLQLDHTKQIICWSELPLQSFLNISCPFSFLSFFMFSLIPYLKDLETKYGNKLQLKSLHFVTESKHGSLITVQCIQSIGTWYEKIHWLYPLLCSLTARSLVAKVFEDQSHLVIKVLLLQSHCYRPHTLQIHKNTVNGQF